MGINAEYMGTVRFGPPTENIASSKMKCFLVFATLAVAAHALPQYYIADTPEVQAAKAQFAAAWNAAAARNAAPVAPIHHAAAPVAPVTFNNVIAGVSSGCFNYKGESVPCRY